MNISRGTVYYLLQPVSPADLALMRRLDELHLEHPFMGAHMLRDQLARQGIRAGRRHIRTEIVNTDQGSQFTAEEFTRVVLAKGCKLSMDRRGAWRDNVFVERLWRSVKYERVYLQVYDGVNAARSDIAIYMYWYNTHRPHSKIERLTPEEKYIATLPPLKLAA